MTLTEFDRKLDALRQQGPDKSTILIDERTAYETFGKGQFKNMYTYKGYRVIISTHLPDYTILPVG